MVISARAPTRIDLAGGTLDIYPLYLFLEGGVTVNMAIDLVSQVQLQTRQDQGFHLLSRDTGLEVTASTLEELPLKHELGLVSRVLRFYRSPSGLEVTTHNLAPHGSGLGASSALLIALTGALDRLNATRLSGQEMIDLGANLEAQSIGIPTGKQDHCAALFGGVNAIHFEVSGLRVESLVKEEAVLEGLERGVILSFTGVSHFSATSNWNMLKAFIENQGTTVQNLTNIKQTALRMREKLLDFELEGFTPSAVEGFASLVAEEWENRKRLAEGVTNDRIEQITAAAARAGALASKVCGAGGGGCLISVAPPDKREAVIGALEGAGAKPLPYRISREGLVVTEATDA
jgi:D-glycero-alpha-D-manno-heptose-7-phosphate kinase